MKKEKHYYIRGNENGKAVIDKLISMGGKNANNLKGDSLTVVYFVYPKTGIIHFADNDSIFGRFIVDEWEEIKIDEPEPEPETVTFTVQKGQTNCDNCKFKSLCYDANIELVHLLKCNVYDLNSITEVERQK